MFLQDLFQSQNVQLSTNADTAKSLPETEVKTQLSKLPRPDVTQMLPFKPKILARKLTSCCGVFFVLLQVSFADALKWIHIASLILLSCVLIFSVPSTIFCYGLLSLTAAVCGCFLTPFSG